MLCTKEHSDVGIDLPTYTKIYCTCSDGTEILSLYKKDFWPLVFSVLITYTDRNSWIMDRSSFHLILYRHSLLCY